MLSDLHLKVNEPVDSRGAGCRRRGLWTSSVYIFAFLFVFVAFFSVSPSHALAAERYWVGGSGNWSDDDTHWATTSGGAPADGNVPTSADNAHFNADSNTTAYTVTVDATANMLDLMFDAAPSVSGTITWAGSSSMTISGSFLGLSGMTRTYTGDLIFNSTSSGKTITMNGVTTTTSQYSFNGVGGVWTLQDTVNLNSGTLILTNGTLDTNGKTVSANYFQSTSGTRTLTLGASAINLSYASAGAWNVTSSLTLTANTATITLSGTSGGFTGGGLTYGSVVFTGTTQTISDANTFTNLTRTGGANYTSTLVLSANQTITGTFTATGNSAVNRLLIKSDTAGTARTITAAAVSLTDVDFTDITGAGAATWTGTRLGNAAGNSGITFTDAANKYYVGNTANWNGTVWALTSGGEAGANNFPLPQDTAKLDANSFSADSQTLTINGAFRLPSIVAAGTDQTYTLATGSNAPTLYGTAYTLDSNTTISGTSALTFSGRNTQTVTSAGKSWSQNFIFDSIGGSFVLADDLSLSGLAYLYLQNGNLNLSGHTLTGRYFGSSNANVRSITSGGGVIVVNGEGTTVWTTSNATNFTLNDALQVNCTGATGTNRVYHGDTAGTEANVPSFAFTGAATVRINDNGGSDYKSLDFTGFTGELKNAGNGFPVTVYGNLTLAAAQTIEAGTDKFIFAATSGTQIITSNTKTLDFPITINAAGATVQLADNLTMGSTRTLTLTAGTLDLNGKTLTTGLLSSTNTNTRGIKSSTSGGKIIANSTSATATINFSTATNFTIDRSTAPWTIEVGGDTTNVRTINTGGLTLPALTFTNATASGELDISHNAPGTGTFKSISVSTPPQTLKFTSGTNTTIEDTTTGFPSGTSGSLVTVGTISGTATLTKSGGGRVCSDYLAFSNITGSPATTAWYVGSGSSGSGTGLIFSACPDVPATNPVVPHATAGMLTASGGTLSTIVEKGVTYRVHTFTTAGTSAFKVTGGSGNVQYLVVGGGGGGGSGGGGAGGFRANSAYNYAVSNGSYTVTVGGGGAAAANGSNSVFDTITAAGGGAGASTGTGTSGGSGGGGGSDASTSGGAGTPGQGNSGGAGVTNFGGGGGGASAAGDAGTTQGGNGGAGTASVVSGTSVTYAGGGGGAGSTPGAAGAGGGGAGSATTGADGTAATGGGGGGGVSAGGSGGSGIVIIRYPISTVTIKPSCNPTTVIGQDGRTYGTVLAADGNCWLDRNLGAPQVATASGNGTGYGDLYQWGRLYDGHQATTSAVTFTGSAGDVPGNASFIATTTSPYDWRNQRNNNLWQGVNGTNNVCPTGFRLPTQPEWSALVTAEGITNAATAFSSSLKLPVAGYRGRANGSLYDQGSGGYYWSSGVSGTFASHLFFNAIGVFPANADYRAVGFSVRCVRNQKAAKVTVNASRNTTLTNGLVGLWSFDGADVAGTTAYDRSGSGNNGTLTGGVSKVIGKLGQALKFDGSTGSIRITNGYTNTISGDDTHTVSLWLKGNSFSNQPVIITADSISNLFFLETNNTGTGLFWGYGGAHRTYSSSNVSNGWHQIVMVKTGTGNSGNLYVDGVLQTSYTGSFTSISTNTLDMLIADYLSPGFEFNGSVDEVRIYNRALTSAEIKLLYTSGK